ncbi:hypothetical protein [Halomicrococcus sp. NG-SE-24]|uniref:hypothetical protein n=1 Tax=Halomicrococcus sp. NG-SE-24 TaxID=3436928 RepID=UPI003D97278D
MNLGRFRHYTDWHRHVNGKRYDAPADPWKLLPVSPDDVTYYNDELRLNWGLGRVQGGDWDGEENCRPFRETTLYRGLEQRFEDGRDWEETALYRWAEEQFESGETVRGYESMAEFRTVRCEYIDELFRRIDREGYRPNEEAAHEKATDDNPFEDAYANHLEPLVVIGRDGEVYWTEGNHRFAIASILDVDAIPVYVLCRHENWQAVRDRLHDTPREELPSELEAYLGHPDVQDVRPE